MAVTERKYYDSATSLLIDTSTTSWLNSNVTPASHGGLCLPAQGTNGSQRIGRSIKLCNLRISGCIHSDPLNDSASIQPTSGMTIRIILALDKQPNGSQMPGDLLMLGGSSVTVYAFQNPASFGRARILKDLKLTAPAPMFTSYTGSSAGDRNGVYRQFTLSYKPKVPLTIHFNNGTTSDVANLIDNNFLLYAHISEHNNALSYPLDVKIQYSCRASFIDP